MRERVNEREEVSEVSEVGGCERVSEREEVRCVRVIMCIKRGRECMLIERALPVDRISSSALLRLRAIS